MCWGKLYCQSYRLKDGLLASDPQQGHQEPQQVTPNSRNHLLFQPVVQHNKNEGKKKNCQQGLANK